MNSFPNGILLVDKPQGVTSFAVVSRVREVLQRDFPRTRKRPKGPGGRPPRFRCGHAGTLDPLATGLLIVLVGRGSRLAPFLLGLDKSYDATVRFGTETDTLDAEGQVISEAALPESPRCIEDCLPRFRGAIQQVPPVYSALKRNGKTLHRLARSGVEVQEPEPRTVTITRLATLAVRMDDHACAVDLGVDCGSGTYIRSLARDLGRAARSAAHLEALSRTRIGPFCIQDACEGIMSASGEIIHTALLPLAEALPHLPRLDLTNTETLGVLRGGQPRPEWLERLSAATSPAEGKGEYFAMMDPDGDLVAVGEIEEDSRLPRLAAVVGKEGDA